MKRRSFLAGMMTTAAGLLVPYEPQRIYSFPLRLSPEDQADVDYFNRKLFAAIERHRLARGFEVPLQDFPTTDFPALVKKLAEHRDLIETANRRFNPLAYDEDYWIPAA